MRTGVNYREALALALAGMQALDVESLPMASALGRTIADDLMAPFALPGFANAAMDGFAIRAQDLAIAGERGLLVTAGIFAGDTAHRRLEPGTAMKIMTGALMPDGADTVAIRENARIEDGIVHIEGHVGPGANVRSADDDCAAGDLILPAGTVLDAHGLGILASFGFENVQVRRRPRVAILVTGDELRQPGESLRPGLRYDSNGAQLAAAATIAGAEVVARTHCADDAEALALTIRRLSDSCDVLLTSGGVSVGEADLLPDVIGRIGEIVFRKVRIKPGMPVLYASVGKCRVFALPGNAVSCGVAFHVLVRPVLAAMLGRVGHDEADFQARLGSEWRKNHSRLEFLRVRLSGDGQGGFVAMPFRHQGSGALSVLARANALAVLAEGARDYAAGEVVEVLPLPSFPSN
jgi:molybdopterin molybdotransferase